MKHIVFAWELGANYGHIAKNMSLLRPLLKMGFKVSFVLRDLMYVHQLRIPPQVDVYQAPSLLAQKVGSRKIHNYSDILLSIGYNNSAFLVGALRGWFSLWDTLQPDLVICDHAPTALISAKIKKFTVVNFGTGFEVPEPRSPFSSLVPWQKVSQDSLFNADQELLKHINASLEALQVAPYKDLVSLFKPNHTLLCSLPELDPYIGRLNTPYWGPMVEVDAGVNPQWPSAKGAKVFVYLKPELKVNKPLLKALSSLGHSVIVHFIGGVIPKMINSHDLAGIEVSTQPVKMSQVMLHADLIVCHASHGMVANALLEGLPLLLLPTQQEQKNTATRLLNLGLALELTGQETEIKIRKKVKRLLTEPPFVSNAQVMSEKYKDFDLHQQVQLIAQECSNMCR